MLPDLDYNEEARKLWSRLGDGTVMKPFHNILVLIMCFLVISVG
jgi:hypothetical protein